MPRGAVIFDLDGTLVDSAPDIAFAANCALADLGLAPREAEEVRGFIGNGAEKLMHRCLTGALDGIAETARFEEAYRAFQTHYQTNLSVRTVIYPGVVETLSALRDDGYALACVTNKPARFTEPLLEQLSLAPYFGVTLSGDSLPVKKPDPTPLLHALGKLGVAAGNGAMVGDSMADLRAGRAAGTAVFCVSYGYSPHVDLREHAPDALVDNFGELLGLLRARLG